MPDAALANLKDRVFFHGTTLRSAERIAQEGFKVWRLESFDVEEEETFRVASGGALGLGIYLSCDWRIALQFGSTLLGVIPIPGTRVLDSTVPPDRSVLKYLQREFGRAILSDSPLKILPRNKQLKLSELIALFRYHYHKTWVKRYRKDRSEWPRVRQLHASVLDCFRSLLIRHGFHGYGDPVALNGVVIFSGDRLDLNEVIADLSWECYIDYLQQGPHKFKSLDQIRTYFRLQGSERAKQLARMVAGPEND